MCNVQCHRWCVLVPNGLAMKCTLTKLRALGNCSSVWLRCDLADLEAKSAEGQMWLTSYGQHNEDEERFGFCLTRQRYSRRNWEPINKMVTDRKVTNVIPIMSPCCYPSCYHSEPIMSIIIGAGYHCPLFNVASFTPSVCLCLTGCCLILTISWWRLRQDALLLFGQFKIVSAWLYDFWP